MIQINLSIAILWLVLGVYKIDDPGSTTGGSQPMVHAFGGQPVKVDLAVETPSGTPVEIKADLFQKGQSLLMPIQKDIAVAQGIRAGEHPSFRPLLSWTFPVPEVKRETEMIARLRIKTANGEWTPAGQILIRVYPPEFTKETLAAISRQRGLHIFGETNRLRDFLKAQKVEFHDEGNSLAALPTNPDEKGIYLGESTTGELADWLAAQPGWPGNLVVFCADSHLMSGVFVTEKGGFRTVKVTLPLLDNLSSDPQSQKTLLEILNTLTAP